MRSLIAVVLAVAGLASAAPAFAQEEPLTVETLLRRFSSMPGFYARFREEKRIALLRTPLASEGELFFAPRAKLLRRVNSPTRSVALIDGETLTFASGGRRERIDLAANATVRAFVETFTHVLAGDRRALEGHYDIELSLRPEAGPRAWRLRLVPKQRELRRFLRELVLTGDDGTIEHMRMVEVSGDTTDTTFSDVDARRRWSRQQIQRLFRVD
jgi:outer membrane lipoprotein-sorting protein